MFHIFFLVVALSGAQQIGMSNDTYETKEACQAKLEESVNKVDEALGGKAVVAAALCDTEAGFKAKMSEQGA